MFATSREGESANREQLGDRRRIRGEREPARRRCRRCRRNPAYAIAWGSASGRGASTLARDVCVE
jgi:hypothetical protein